MCLRRESHTDVRSCPLAATLQGDINECLELGQNAGKTEFKTSVSALFFLWQQLHGPNSLPGGLLKALKFESWSLFVRCCHPVLQPLKSDEEGCVATMAWARGLRGQGEDFKSFKTSCDTSKTSGNDRWQFASQVQDKSAGKRPLVDDSADSIAAESVFTPSTVSKKSRSRWEAGKQLLETEGRAFMRRSDHSAPRSLLEVPLNTGKAEKLLRLGKLKGDPRRSRRAL